MSREPAPEGASPALAFALEAVERLTRGDHLLVPVQPTAEMLRRGAAASGLSEAEVAAVWAAMVSAGVPMAPAA